MKSVLLLIGFLLISPGFMTSFTRQNKGKLLSLNHSRKLADYPHREDISFEDLFHMYLTNSSAPLPMPRTRAEIKYIELHLHSYNNMTIHQRDMLTMLCRIHVIEFKSSWFKLLSTILPPLITSAGVVLGMMNCGRGTLYTMARLGATFS